MDHSPPLRDRVRDRFHDSFAKGTDPEDSAADAPPSMRAVLRRERLRALEFFFALLPGGLVLYFSFTAGGYFPGSAGLAAAFLGVLLALRLVLLPDPRPALTRASIVAIVAMALFVAWTYLSREWSDAPARSTIATNLGLVYLFSLMLFASFPAENRRLRWILRGLAGAIAVVAGAAVISRTLPDVIDVASFGVGDDRLSYPLTYWNALGFLAGIGFLLSLHITRSTRERPVIRALAAAALPITATCVYLTLSRGAIVATAVGVGLYLLLARRGGLLPTLIAAGPPLVVALVAAYDADLLTEVAYRSSEAMAQGETLAGIVGGAAAVAFVVRLVLAPYEARMRARSPFRHVGGQVRIGAGVLVALVAIAGAVALGAPREISDAYEGFFKGTTGGVSADLESNQQRLTETSGNGRDKIWGIGLDAFGENPVRGSGAGTFELIWLERRENQSAARNAHSIYIETLAELGVVGLGLLVIAILMMLLGSAARIRGSGRSTYALVFGASVAWALHQGVDWDWQLPATTVWMFALGGAALAASPRQMTADNAFDPEAGPGIRRDASGVARVGLTILVLLVVLIPARFALSQHALDDAIDAFGRGDCQTAETKAADALSFASSRTEAHFVKGYCAIRREDGDAAVVAMRAAVASDPENPYAYYALAQALAAAGRSPDRAAETARRLDPEDLRHREALEQLIGAATPEELMRVAQEVPNIGLSRGVGRPAKPVLRVPGGKGTFVPGVPSSVPTGPPAPGAAQPPAGQGPVPPPAAP